MNENKKTIFYLGPEGSNAEVATEKFLSSLNFEQYELIPKPSITSVIEAIDSNSGFIGVVPIENSIEGIVRETIDSLVKTTSRVMKTSEVIVPINHCLISKAKNVKDIKTVISHPQALAQCQQYLCKTFPDGIDIISAPSTSESVKQLNNLPDNCAAIGTARAAQIYNLEIIDEGINDEKDNLTRFVCLSSEIPKPTGNDKTSIAFSTTNQTGALVKVLSAFQEADINLSYIESRPSKRVFGDYTFFMDFYGHIEDENVQRTIGKIAPLVSFYRFLGSFPKTEL